MPSIATSTGSGAVPGSAPPTACTIRPQFGSPPCSAALTSGEFATARAARLDASALPAAHDHAGDPRRALAVGDHHHRELAQQRVERLAEAQLVLALGRDRARRRRRSTSGSRCRSSRAGRRRTRGRRSASRTRRAAGRRSRRASAASVSHEAEHRREARRDHPGALALRAQAHGAGGQLDLEVRALLERVGRLDRLLEVAVAAGRSSARAREDALAASPRRAAGG